MSALEDITEELEAVKADRDRKADACRYMGEIIERQGKSVVAVTGSQDLIGEDGDGDWEGVWDRVFELRRERDRLKNALKAIEKLAEEWRYKGEFGWGAWQEGHGPDPEGYALDMASVEIRKAITEALA